MKNTVRIALIGDHNPQVRAHQAIPKALELAAGVNACTVEVAWIATPQLEREVEKNLAAFDAIWCVPASPYASMEGALRGIQFARERNRPFLGTCGGFQHSLIEYVRNVLGRSEADHAESNPAAAMPLIAQLACSLVGAKGLIKLRPGSRIASIYGCSETIEQYHCNYGLNERYQSLLSGGCMKITGVDDHGDPRVVELEDHPFFFGTLFQPELSAHAGAVHPLIVAFVRSAASN